MTNKEMDEAVAAEMAHTAAVLEALRSNRPPPQFGRPNRMSDLLLEQRCSIAL